MDNTSVNIDETMFRSACGHMDVGNFHLALHIFERILAGDASEKIKLSAKINSIPCCIQLNNLDAISNIYNSIDKESLSDEQRQYLDTFGLVKL